MGNVVLTDKQKNKIRKIADVVKNGEMSIVEFLFELEDRLDQELPALHNILGKIKGEKGDTYNLSDEDLRKIAVHARSLINISQLGKLAAQFVSVPVEEISQKVAKIIGKPKDGKTPTQGELETIIRALMPEAIPGEDGLDADEEAIYEMLVGNLPMLGTAFRDGLELLEGEDRLDVSAIKGWEKLLADLKGSGKSVTIGGGPRGLHVYVDGVKKGLIPTMNFKAGNNVTLSFAKDATGLPTLTINATGGGGGSTGIEPETPTGSVNGVNADFVFSAEPEYIVADGAAYFEGAGYTWNAGTLTATMTIAPSAYVRGLVAGGSAIAPETPTGTVNGANTSFTVSAEPRYVVSDGVTYFDGAGYTYAALTITMDIPPSSFIRAII